MLMTQKEEKWPTYNVDDTTGTHLALVDLDDNTIGYYVFGNSSSDYSRCYVRSNEIPNVYLTNNNIENVVNNRKEKYLNITASI